MCRISSRDSATIKELEPIDRGWAWVILFASTSMLVILIGNLRSFGVFFVELLQEFDTTSSMTSTILGTQSIAKGLTNPKGSMTKGKVNSEGKIDKLLFYDDVMAEAVDDIDSFVALNCLSSILSIRTLIYIGTFFSCTCFILDSVASNVMMLPFFHLLNGAGIAFMYGPSLVIIGNFFKKYRGTANAFVSCGASIGQFGIAPLLSYLITKYGIRGALLLNAGIFLQCFIFASLMRPISYFKRTSSKSNCTTPKESIPLEKALNCEDKDRGSLTLYESHGTRKEGKKPIYSNGEENQEDNTLLEVNIEEVNSPVHCSVDHIDEKDQPGFNRNSMETELIEERFDLLQSSTTKKLSSNSGTDNQHNYTNGSLDSKSKEAIDLKICSNDDGSIYLKTELPVENEKSKCKKLFVKVDFNLFKKKIFIAFLFGYTIGCCSSTIPQSFFPSHSVDIGLTRMEGTLFISVAGFGDLAGRILTTLIADRNFLNRSQFLGVVLLVHGAVACWIPFFKTFWSFIAYCILYRLSGGVFFAITTTVLTDYIGVKRLPQGLGMVMLSTGFNAAYIYPSLGYLRDYTGSYNIGFILNGVGLIISGICFLAEGCISYKKESKL